jgi:serine/threonine-protein kinase HipA
MLPSHSGQSYQEFICGKQGRDSTLDNAISECDAFGLTPAEAAAEVVRVLKVVNTWKLHFAQMSVSPRDVENLAQQIDGDYLLKQRASFEPQRFISLPIKRQRKGPFSAA